MNIYEQQLQANRLALDLVQRDHDLNEGIAKLATNKDLSRVEIQELICATNHATNDYLRKSAEDKTYTFELADLDVVVNLLDEPASSGHTLDKIAGAVTNLNRDTGSLDRLLKIARANDTFSRERERTECRSSLIKLASMTKVRKKEAQMDLNVHLEKISSELDNLTQQVRDYLVLTGTSLGDIRKYASLVPLENDNVAPVIIEEVVGRLEKLGHPFTGLLATDKELRQESHKRKGVEVPEPEVTVLNGQAPLFKTLKIINASMVGATEKQMLIHELDSLASHVASKEEMLGDNESTNRNVLETLDSLYSTFVSQYAGSHEKRAFVGNVIRGLGVAKKVGRKALSGASTLSGGRRGLAKNVGRAGAAATAGAVVGTALKAGRAVSGISRSGFSQSLGGVSADSANSALN